MKLLRTYSSKLLSVRQKIILFSSVSVCVLAFAYTYFAVMFMQKAMMISVADYQPHIRLYLSTANDAIPIVRFLRDKKEVARADDGVLIEDDFVVISRPQLRQIGKEDKIFFSGSKHIIFVGYSFQSENYRPPVLLENVYSRICRDTALRHPDREPIRNIIDVKDENYCIISKNLTPIFDLVASAYGDLFEVASKDKAGKIKHVFFRTAGYINDSPLTINNATLPSTIYTKRGILEHNFADYAMTPIVDIALKDRGAVGRFSREIQRTFHVRKVETWMDKNPTAIPFLDGIKTIAFAGVCAITLLSVIGLGILISILVVEKTKQLAILYAMGCDALELRCLFLWIGIRCAFISLCVGGGLGFLLSRASIPFWNRIIENFCYMPHAELACSWFDIILFSLAIISSCLIAAWLPTRQIVKSDPINNLRNE